MERLVNTIGAAVLLILIIPLMAVIAVAIRVDSKGPAIFKQKRVGKDSKYFTLYKFRTMQVGMPDVPSDMVSKDDCRYTRLGKFLRRLSLDELPQLINILKGDMNFIGPRPALYNQDDLIRLRCEGGVNRLKPGVTGWAQVNGRDNISVEKKVLLDKYYLEKHSFFMDMKIIYLTLIKSVLGLDLYNEQSSNLNDPKDRCKTSA